MGRPLNKKFFGATGDNTQPTIPCRADISGTDFEGFIVNQKGTRKFTVSNDGETLSGVCTLVNKINGHAAGEVSIVGVTDGGGAVALQKLTANKATDYDGNPYTWTVADDSSESLLRLTAI